MIYRVLSELASIILLAGYFKKCFLKANLTTDDELFLKHTNPKIIYFSMGVMVIGLIWSLISDLGFSSHEIAAHSLPFVGFYLMALKGLYIRYKYGPKDWEYMEKTKLGAMSAFFLAIIYLGLAITWIQLFHADI